MAVEVRTSGEVIRVASDVASIAAVSTAMSVNVPQRIGTVSVASPHELAEVRSETWEARVVSGVIIGGITYEGPYEVVPDADGDVLTTRTKTMRDDVTVRPIPYVEASNEQGGYTVSIAS